MRFHRKQKQPEEAHIDLTPMLDIVFILLIFFIVTSSSIKDSGVDVSRPLAKNAAQQKQVAVFVTISAANEIYINKERIDEERVQVILEKLMSSQSAGSLMIQADERAFNGTVVKVIDAAKGAGIEHIALAAKTP